MPDDVQLEIRSAFKPIVRAPVGVSLSFAHTATLCLCAATTGGIIVGLDGEPMARSGDAVEAAESFLAAEEARLLCGGIDAAQVLRAWVAKEAVLKGSGHGFWIDPRQLSVLDEEGCLRAVVTLGRFEWQLDDFVWLGHQVVVATRRDRRA